MNNTCQLHQLMTLNATMNTTDIEDRFEQIAKMLFESFAIQKGEKKYLLRHKGLVPVSWYLFHRQNNSTEFLI